MPRAIKDLGAEDKTARLLSVTPGRRPNFGCCARPAPWTMVGDGEGGRTRTWLLFLSRGGDERRFEPNWLLGPGRVGLVLVDDDSRPAMELFEGLPASAAEMEAEDRGGRARGWYPP